MNRLADDAKLECRICWYVYDPAVGDDKEQIPPGTPFLELPDYWRCPQCDSEADAFLPVSR
ncbi:MAG: rubredoxin [Gammaproteobacteria bacterium]|nr:rubredoxin [Gammaproteobacteria bacterium]MDH5239521.1 rubredoxin [Gammaproteobacteria bacterium]MDH5260133.1 rubredoxin [Gammaproteobacteria bacterium]MDH5584225.1 rubredoxin [Gammaproteobacteria bacterium]